MARTNKHERNYIVTLLTENEKLSTAEILEAVNSRYTWGFTPYQLGNIMAKDRRFKKLDETARVESLAGDGSKSYKQAMWALKD